MLNESFKIYHSKFKIIKIVLCFLRWWEYFRSNKSSMLKGISNNVNTIISVITEVIVIIIHALCGG